ncbi:MAG: glycosyltransferase [Roseivirga sp.]|uniref:glycosyltransferase family 4 protein n=1 Tax=Roseivirga sp. TaxID=1964215 RepID=UPI001B05A2B9|nr:glycosyltransferase [Roseivirga sp.]MBO6497707.1 glycosyltransferase [Roseivirga sp.]
MSQSLGVEFWCDKREIFGIKTIDFIKNPDIKVRAVRNLYFKSVLIWQSSVLIPLVKRMNKTDIVLVLGEMYCISNWIILLLCKLKSKPTLIWTHGLYGNEHWFKRKIRSFFYRLGTQVLTYGNRSRELLIKEKYDQSKVHTIYNSLCYEEHLRLRKALSLNKSKTFSFFKNPELPCLIFIGRLTQVKRLDLLANAFNKLNKDYNLLIIGDGSMKGVLQAQLSEAMNEKRVYFYGALYDEQKIGALLFNADLCVSPGNIGLTCIHSLSFGTPVCTHNVLLDQMPEVEAIIPGYNGFLFQPNSSDSIRDGIQSWFDESLDKTLLKSRCYEVIDLYFNPNNQIRIFNSVFNSILNKT